MNERTPKWVPKCAAKTGAQKAVPNETHTPVTRSTWEKVNVERDPTVKIGCTHWERGSRVGMITDNGVIQ